MNKSLAIIVCCFVAMNMRLVIATSGVLYRPQIPLALWKKQVVSTAKSFIFKQPTTPLSYTRDQTKSNEGNGREWFPRGPLLKRIVPFLGNHKTDPNIVKLNNEVRSTSTYAPYHTGLTDKHDAHKHDDHHHEDHHHDGNHSPEEDSSDYTHPGDGKHKHDHSTSTVAPDHRNDTSISHESIDTDGITHHHHHDHHKTDKSTSTHAPHDKKTKPYHTPKYKNLNQTVSLKTMKTFKMKTENVTVCSDASKCNSSKWHAFREATTQLVQKYTQDIFIWHRKHILS